MHAVIGAFVRTTLVVVCLSAAAAAVTAPQSSGADKGCVLAGANVMSFGVYDSMSDAPLDVQGRIIYRCGGTNQTSARTAARTAARAAANGKLVMQISLSTGNAGSFQRYMTSGRDRLRYNLYLDPERTTIWGNGTNGSQVYTTHAQLDSRDVVLPVFGRVFADQDVGAGLYLDQIIITLEF